jgi:hypothetical protein
MNRGVHAKHVLTFRRELHVRAQTARERHGFDCDRDDLGLRHAAPHPSVRACSSSRSVVSKMRTRLGSIIVVSTMARRT